MPVATNNVILFSAVTSLSHAVYPAPVQPDAFSLLSDEPLLSTAAGDFSQIFLSIPNVSPILRQRVWQYSQSVERANKRALREGTILFVEGRSDSLPFSKPPPFAKIHTKYKRVDQKIKPVPAVMPQHTKVIRQIPEDPLLTLPDVPFFPPDFTPTAYLTLERMAGFQFDESFLLPDEIKLARHVIAQNERAFAWDAEERGLFRDDYFSPYVIPTVDHIPWALSNFPVAPGLRPALFKLVEEKKAAKTYEPSQSSYRSRWFCVPKKETGAIRIVHDLRPLNAVTIRDAGLPPVLDEFVEDCAGRAIYTVLDIFWGYDNRTLAKSSRDLTAFQTPLEPLQLTSIPMGFTNAIAEFCACVVFIFAVEIARLLLLAFLDDLAVKGPTTRYIMPNGDYERTINPGIRRFVYEHLCDLNIVFHKLKCSGATLGAKKSQLLQAQVSILGQICTSEGRIPDNSKIQKVLNWPIPTSTKELRGFLGLCGGLRVWIRNYSLHVRPLTLLLRKDAEYVWTEAHSEAFDNIKQLITTYPVLVPIDYNSDRPVILAVDTSQIAVGMVLYQLDGEQRKRPARFGSIPLNERESRYSQPKLELYGLFRALSHFKIYLVGAKRIIVEVDAKYIKGMLLNPSVHPEDSINRWIAAILLFTFELRHVPAREHSAPDALSRRPPLEHELLELGERQNQANAEFFACALVLTKAPGLFFNHTTSFSYYHPISTLHFEYDSLPLSHFSHVFTSRKVSIDNDTLKAIFEFLSAPVPSPSTNKTVIDLARQFRVQNGQLIRLSPSGLPLVVIYDETVKLRILEQAHDELGHKGVFPVKRLLNDRFWWPNLFVDVIEFLRTCHPCQIRSTKKVRIPLTPSFPATLFTRIHVDIMHLDRSGGFHYLVAARDDLSGASEGRALRKNNSKSVAKFLWEEIICRYGAVAQVTTDNGSEFKGAVDVLMKKYGIPQIKISAYNSGANGVVERSHFDIREGLMKATKNGKGWHELVPHIFFADRVTTRRATGYSPYQLLYGTEPVLPFDLAHATLTVEGFRSGMSTADLLALRTRQLQLKQDDIERAAVILAKNRFDSKLRYEEQYRVRLFTDDHEPGTLVLIRNTGVEDSLDRKSKDRYLGPFEVVERTRHGAYILKELNGTVLKNPFAAFRLLPYFSRSNNPLFSRASLIPPASPPSSSSSNSSSSDDEEDRGRSSFRERRTMSSLKIKS